MGIPRTPDINYGLPMEEEELEAQQQEEPDEDDPDPLGVHDKDNPDALSGEYVPFCRKYTGNSSPIDPRQIRVELKKKQNLYEIEPSKRGAMYRYWEKAIIKQMTIKARVALMEYQVAALNYKSTKVSNQRYNTIMALQDH